jgi:hypothetical protein
MRIEIIIKEVHQRQKDLGLSIISIMEVALSILHDIV